MSSFEDTYRGGLTVPRAAAEAPSACEVPRWTVVSHDAVLAQGYGCEEVRGEPRCGAGAEFTMTRRSRFPRGGSQGGDSVQDMSPGVLTVT
jgi:hypothetical protein